MCSCDHNNIKFIYHVLHEYRYKLSLSFVLHDVSGKCILFNHGILYVYHTRRCKLLGTEGFNNS